MYRSVRLKRYTLYRRIDLLQPPCRSDKRSTCSQPGNEVGNHAIGILPDLRRSRLVVCTPVRIVVVLVRIEIALRIVGCQLACETLRLVGPSFQRIRQNQIRAEDAEQTPPLDAHVGRDHEPASVSAGRTDRGVCDSGVATGCIDQRPARSQQTALFSITNHCQGRTILYRATGIEPLRLTKNPYPRTAPAPRHTQLYQRGITNEIIYAHRLQLMYPRTYSLVNSCCGSRSICSVGPNSMILPSYMNPT